MLSWSGMGDGFRSGLYDLGRGAVENSMVGLAKRISPKTEIPARVQVRRR